jgi:hypothetical protein
VKKHISGSNLFLLVTSLPIISNYIRKTAVNLVRFVHNDHALRHEKGKNMPAIDSPPMLNNFLTTNSQEKNMCTHPQKLKEEIHSNKIMAHEQQGLLQPHGYLCH